MIANNYSHPYNTRSKGAPIIVMDNFSSDYSSCSDSSIENDCSLESENSQNERYYEIDENDPIEGTYKIHKVSCLTLGTNNNEKKHHCCIIS